MQYYHRQFKGGFSDQTRSVERQWIWFNSCNSLLELGGSDSLYSLRGYFISSVKLKVDIKLKVDFKLLQTTNSN